MNTMIRMLAVLGLGLSVTLATMPEADAKRGGGFGSRGQRTYQAPPPTQTAPQSARPIERSTTPQPGQAAQPRAAQPGVAPGAAAAQAARPSMASNLMRGLLIGGLVGALLGYGFGGLAGMLGFLLQAGLIILAVVLVMRLIANRRRNAPQPIPARAGFDPMGRARDLQTARTMAPPASATMAAAQADAQRLPEEPIALQDGDLETFQRMLAEIEAATARGDVETLHLLATAEAANHLADDIAAARRSGHVTTVSGVELLQGDVSEAWREGRDEYATVSMRYASRTVTRDSQGQIIAGDADRPTEVTEFWTFVRPNGGRWKLTAIQEAAAA